MRRSDNKGNRERTVARRNGQVVRSTPKAKISSLRHGSRPANLHTMLRPHKKYSVYDLQQLKGKRCLTHVHVKSPEEAAAAEAAGIDLLSCSFDSTAAQARLPLLVAAAPNSFISGSTPHGMASQEEAIRTGFKALELGASSVYCSSSPWMI